MSTTEDYWEDFLIERFPHNTIEDILDAINLIEKFEKMDAGDLAEDIRMLFYQKHKVVIFYKDGGYHWIRVGAVAKNAITKNERKSNL